MIVFADALRSLTMTIGDLRELPHTSNPIEEREWLDWRAKSVETTGRNRRADPVACGLLHASKDREWADRLGKTL